MTLSRFYLQSHRSQAHPHVRPPDCKGEALAATGDIESSPTMQFSLDSTSAGRNDDSTFGLKVV